MARAKVRLDSRGMAAMAKNPLMQRAIRIKAEQAAAKVRSMGIRVQGVPGAVDLPVKVESDVTDRARSTVTIAHAAGQSVQAKHGALTKAAAQAGMDVKDKSR